MTLILAMLIVLEVDISGLFLLCAMICDFLLISIAMITGVIHR